MAENANNPSANPYDPYTQYLQANAFNTQANVQWANAGINAANQAAQASYQQGLLSGAGEDRALAAAKFAWQQEMDKAGLTGQYQGQWTMPSNQWFANTFGAWAAPTAGQQTMAKQAQDFSQAQQLAQMYGQAYTPGGAGPAAGTQTMAGQQQAFNQGLALTQEQRLQQALQQQTANQYLTLLSNLRGPADWAKYQEVLGAAGGMNGLVAQAMGQYIPGGGATSGIQPQAMNLNTMMNQVGTGNAQAPWQAGTGVQMPGASWYGGQAPQVWGQGQQQNQAQQNLQALGGGSGGQASSTYSPTQTWQQLAAAAPGSTPIQAGNESWRQANAWGPEYAAAQARAQQQQQPQQTAQQYNQLTQQQMQATGNGTNTMGAPKQQYNLPAPNQIALQSWNNMAPSSQQMLLGQYEAQGWHKPDVEALIKQQTPRYASNAATAGTWRLR